MQSASPWGSTTGTLLTSKHENSIAYDTNLRYIRQPPTSPARCWSLWTPCQPEVLHQRDQLAVGHRLRPAELSPMWSGSSSAAPYCQRPGRALLTITGIPPEKIVCRRASRRRRQLIRRRRERGPVRGHLLLRPGQAAESAGCEKGGLSHGTEHSAFLSGSHEPVRQLRQRVHSEADAGGHGQYRFG